MPTPLWKLICPRDNWRQPVEFPGEALPAMKAAADRLGLVRTVDEAGRKLYLDMPTPASSGTGDITAHFSWAEFHSHDGVKVPANCQANVRALCAVLEKVRSKLGYGLVILSGYRSPAHNAAVGGVQGSEHTKGLAADVWAPELEREHGMAEMLRRIIAVCRSLPEVHGLGVNYDSFVHIDIRPGSSRVEW